jgi:hypothetical protein
MFQKSCTFDEFLIKYFAVNLIIISNIVQEQQYFFSQNEIPLRGMEVLPYVIQRRFMTLTTRKLFCRRIIKTYLPSIPEGNLNNQTVKPSTLQ